MGLAACGGGWAARAPGPACACLNNLVVADTLRMSVSTFAFTFTAFCKRSSLFGTCHRCCTALRRPKNARSTAAVNLTRQIATWCVAATITVCRRGLRGGLGRRGRHEFGSLTLSSAVAQRSDHGCLPPTSTAHPATLADHEELGCNTATKYAFDAPLFVLARSSDDCHVAALRGCSADVVLACAGLRLRAGYDVSSVYRCGAPGVQLLRPDGFNMREFGAAPASAPNHFAKTKASPKIDLGGGPGLVFLYFLTLIFSFFHFGA